ncbi:Type IV site-specific deoxyribonuclease Eco57I related protein [Halorhabdus tiamatea SARL4B]|uniref:site-specific DNA-methyltransferase (adenine-specific) n=3 Tax=Halorhabdus TaxID=146825 RepID=U2DYD9_9EURY|nr:Type IV site-specific deoxyribonuclease Eco57I related protein [Halorhabdus tiamatea SARL4B]
MLTDNSLGKLYLEDRGELQDTVKRQDSMTPDERKNRPLSPDESPDIADFCTYLVPSEEEGEPPAFDGPEDIRVIDPACGSGHFLLYAFDVLERIYRAETNLDHAKIPREILRNNLYGVDLDMRACQLAAFNLYLKGRTRAEAEGANGFDMPEVGIVCADAKVADIDGVEEVFDEVADGKSDVEDALSRILDAFEEVHGLGSLLDVRGTLGDLFKDEVDQESVQITLDDDPREDHTLGQILHSLREAVDQHREEDSFLAQDLRSFVRLLDVLAQDYDVALMNPPYGSRKRMPDRIQAYVEDNYRYYPEYYISFVEICRRFTRRNGRIGVLMPRSFMFKKSFEEFRTDFVEREGSFDFLAEFGLGILDNATVRTVGTVLRTGSQQEDPTGTFLRLHDLRAREKENEFISLISGGESESTKRVYNINLSEFTTVPGTPISYYIPQPVRQLHLSKKKVDADTANIEGEGIATIATGLQTGNNDRFLRKHWEVSGLTEYKPYAKGGSDAWIAPTVHETVDWREDGAVLRRAEWSVLRNEPFYGEPGLTWTYIKETGRRFGHLPPGCRFDVAGSMVFPTEVDAWELMVALNSQLYHALVLSLTPERQWNQGDIGRLPWVEEVSDKKLRELGQNQYQTAIEIQRDDPTSPYYTSPTLLADHSADQFYEHSFSEQLPVTQEMSEHLPKSRSLAELAEKSVEQMQEARNALEKYAQEVDDHMYRSLDIGKEAQFDIEREISLRTAETVKQGKKNPVDIPLNEQVKDLVHHFAMEAVREESDGIIPLEGTDEQADLLDRIVERFEDAYGEYAEDRLVEVDGILGAESAGDEAYPNLRSFIKDDLFAYHVDTMENTPIVWKLSTARLLADAKGEGFACFVDYHQLDASLFDRLSNEYLEPRKAELRDRRSAANQRRNDESLSTSDRADATDEFEFCSSALEQIAEFEEVMQELGSTSERDFDADDRELVEELAPKVAAFRDETAERIDTLEQLRERNDEEWFQDTFSDGFWNKVDEWREEWLDALDELEHACEEYAKPSDEPVEAHLADLFDYFNWRLKGSDHYSSTGILFMTYYFEREGAELLNEDGDPFDNLTEDERMLASLATGVDDASIINEEYLEQVADDEDVDDVDDLPPLAEFKALAEEIDDRCQTVDKRIPSDWSDRALSEITTAGYQPNQKHGVAINITPLAEQSVVPDIVEDKIL